MIIELNHIGGSAYIPSSIIEAKIISNNTIIEVDVTDNDGKVKDSIIDNLEDVLNELRAHNRMVRDRLNNNNLKTKTK